MPHFRIPCHRTFALPVALPLAVALCAAGCVAFPDHDSEREPIEGSPDGGAIWPLDRTTDDQAMAAPGVECVKAPPSPQSAASGDDGLAVGQSDDSAAEAGEASMDTVVDADDAGIELPSEQVPEDAVQMVADQDAPVVPAPASVGDVVVTEIMANPASLADSEGEWIELHNATDGTLELAGCTLGEGMDGDPSFVELRLAAGAHATVARSQQPGFPPDAVISLSLRNTSDILVLRCGATEIDRVAYDAASQFPVVAGASMSLSPTVVSAQENDIASNWCAATSTFGGDLGTPGAPNDVCATGMD